MRIPARFNGPPGSANGGYACGAFAAAIEGPARVVLRVPPPMERDHRAVAGEGGSVSIMLDDELVAEVSPSDGLDDLAVPAPVTMADAAATATGYREAMVDHIFPNCFVCGTTRPAPDGLALHTGLVAGRDGLVAAPWVPDASLPNADGALDAPVVWAALDCPTYFAATGLGAIKGLLGTLEAVVTGPIEVGGEYVVMAWPLTAEGRKLDAAAAITTATGEVVARSRARWITAAAS